MNSDFSRSLTLLRKEKGVSQRKASAALGISQALLSHYENGIREPGLAFVIRACDYYNVSADFLLGRTLARDGATIDPEELYDLSAEKDNVLRGSVMATLNKKLLVNSIGVLFDLLGRTGSREAILAASDCIGSAIYRIFRHLHRAAPDTTEDFFSIAPVDFDAGLVTAEAILAEREFMAALAAHNKEKGAYPPMSHDALKQNYPGLFQSLLQVLHNTGERVNRLGQKETEKKA